MKIFIIHINIEGDFETGFHTKSFGLACNGSTITGVTFILFFYQKTRSVCVL